MGIAFEREEVQVTGCNLILYGYYLVHESVQSPGKFWMHENEVEGVGIVFPGVQLYWIYGYI